MARLIVNAPRASLGHASADDLGWRFVMEHSGKTIYADTRTELVGHILGPEYDALPDDPESNDRAFVMRAGSAIVTADLIQQIIAAGEAERGSWNAGAPSDYELTAFLTSRADHPTELLGITEWRHPVPLVLVRSHFEPYARRAVPTGDIAWIDPTNETTFLDSLAALGQLSL